jgi:DNA sulfur modification protein DndB
MKELEPLFLPALRGLIGDWTYYSTIMRFRDIKDRIEYAQDIHLSKKLQEWIQRQLTPRAKEISDYIKNQPQRFFNSLIVGVYGGDPEWVELKINENDLLPDFPISQRGILGFLKLSGEETLFALDGQHRVAGIKGVLKEQDTGSPLNDEEISIIFIGHKRTHQGIERTRRLFTTLNRYAKPVSLSEIIALDEDDISAIVTRELIDKHGLFSNDRLLFSKTRSIPVRNEDCFTNIIALYNTIDMVLPVFLGIHKNKWGKFKKKRPEKDTIESSLKYVCNLWNKIINKFPALKKYLSNQQAEESKASKFRNKEGGHILFRPIGLLIYFRVISILLEDQSNIDEILSQLSKIETNLSSPPWKGLLWGGATQGMITESSNQAIARDLILYIIGFDLRKIKTNEEKLRGVYAAALNKEIEDVILPKTLI